MRKRHGIWKSQAIRTGLLGVLVMSMLLAAGVPALAADGGSAPAPTTPAATAPQPAQQTGAPGGPQEGIKVHGHWTIEVRNPDGTLVSRHTFENALMPANPFSLILGRKHSVGRWYVIVGRAGTPDVCNLNPCTITEVDSGIPSGPTVFKNLVVNAPVSGVNAGKLVLSGTATALATGQLSVFATGVYVCLPTVVPTACTSDSTSKPVTAVTIPPVNISAGQSFDVTVVLSFS